ncbi:Hypp2068 [Branchiostoma lanceolatum]|uniref:Hypp2068 protein n=1 Tax=Branchiostoma lanceolatum TaxID=7740 RepID=A0A8J9ZRF6_BRALA|nr:Hypp2068 [Branchiostoma lanceolatum]
MGCMSSQLAKTAGKAALFGASAVGLASMPGLPKPDKAFGPKVCAFSSADEASINPGYKVYLSKCAQCHTVGQ